MSIKKEKSFTLIELLVVISIISLLSSVVLVSIKGARERARIAKIMQYAASVHHLLGAYLVAEWKFDEGTGTTAYDTSGNGADITGTLNWSSESASPQLGTALSFPDTNELKIPVSATNPLNVGGGSFSISTWVKFQESISYFAPSVFAVLTAIPTYYIFRYSCTYSSHYSFLLVENDFKVELELGGDDSCTYKIQSQKGLDEKWHFIVVTYDNSAKKAIIYIDGEKDNESGFPDINDTKWNACDTQAYLTFGGWDPLNRTIDELRVYNKSLSLAEVKKLYAQSILKHF